MAHVQVAADDDLESAFIEASVSIPGKKTREGLVKELKLARSSASAVHVAQDGLDRAKMTGKFKPIGAPDKSLEKEKTKKKKRAKDGAEDGERKKKKRKIESEPAAKAERNRDENDKVTEQKVSEEIPNEDPKATRLGPTNRKAPSPPPLVDDDDIFADAGEYDGLKLTEDDDDDDDEKEERPKTLPKLSGRHSPPAGSVSDRPNRNWFGEPLEPDKPPAFIKPSSVPLAPVVSLSASGSMPQSSREEHGGDLIEGAKLRGLTSSAVPSIKDLLAIDEPAEREVKRKATKLQTKVKKLNEEVKLK